MFRRDSRPAPDQIDVVIGPRATFDGRLRCDGSVRLDGTVESGAIEALGNVLITEGARVMADIKAKTVSVAGAFKGNITADRVELLDGGRLWGILNVQSFLLDEGAHFHGELVMQGGESQDPFVSTRPAPGDQIPVEAPGKAPGQAPGQAPTSTSEPAAPEG